VIKISFGIIVLNGQPFLEYNLRALYPFAYQIIVVEGAVRAAESLATADGHSTDGTLQMLREFQRENDPEGKLLVVTAADEGYKDGFWPEKDEMSQAYAKRITGDWLWQVDSDEFYRSEDMQSIAAQLEADTSVTTVSFPYLEFFGSFRSYITGQWHIYEHPLFHRLFRWGPGYRYVNHRPPTVIDHEGSDLREKHWLRNPQNNGLPVTLFHYSYVFPRQARQKVGYYSNVEWTTAFRQNQRWLEDSYMALRRPMFLGERGGLQWLETYEGEHPEVIEDLLRDTVNGKVTEPQRVSNDIKRLLSSPIYSAQKWIAEIILQFYWPSRRVWKRLRQLITGEGPAVKINKV
jgi:hypothetical protein